MADAQLEVLFKVLTDHVGADQAKQVIADLKKQTAGAGDEAKNLTKHSREMREVFHKLNEIVPGLGMAMKAAFNPQMIGMIGTVLALTAIVEVIRKIKQAEEESKKAAEENAAAAAKGYGDVLASVRSVREELLQSDRDVAAWSANLGKVIDPISKNLDAMLEKLKLMDDALRSLDKAAGRQERVPASKAELTASVQALKELSNALESADARFAAAQGNQNLIKQRGGVADYKRQIPDRERKLAEYETDVAKQMANVEEVAKTSGYFRPGQVNFANVIAAKEALDKAVLLRDSEKVALEKLRTEQENFNAAMDASKRDTAAAKNEVEALNKSFESLQQKVQGLQRGLDVGAAAGAAGQQAEFGTLSGGASALVKLKQHGGRASELASADQAALVALEKYLKDHGVLSFGMMKIIQRNAGDIEWLSKEVQRIDNYARSTRKQVHATAVP